jgi:hypothetical protein
MSVLFSCRNITRMFTRSAISLLRRTFRGDFATRAAQITTFLVAAAICSTAYGQVPHRDGQAVSLLAKCAGPLSLDLSNVPTIYATGTLASATAPGGPADSIVLKSKGTDRFRLEITHADGEQTIIVNKSGAAYEQRSGTRTEFPIHSTAFFRPEHLPNLGCLIDLNRQGMNAEYRGTETVRDTPAYHIVFSTSSTQSRFINPKAAEFHVFIDTQSFLVLKTISYVFAPDAIQNSSVWETYYGDYRTVQGILLPFRIEHFSNGQSVNTITLSDVRLNAPIQDADFN